MWLCACPWSPEEVVGFPGAGVIVNHLLWVLGCELVFSGREASACNHLTFFFSLNLPILALRKKLYYAHSPL